MIVLVPLGSIQCVHSKLIYWDFTQFQTQSKCDYPGISDGVSSNTALRNRKEILRQQMDQRSHKW